MQTILHVFGIDWKLLAIQIVNFLILLYILKHFLYAPLLRMLDERRALIAKGVHAAEEAEKNLKIAEEKGQELIKASAKKADEALTLAMTSATHLKERVTQEAEVAKATILKAAETEKERIKKQALLEAEAEIAKLAILGAEKILRKEA
jgi:F-type H+-transporting ATPase subunit b